MSDDDLGASVELSPLDEARFGYRTARASTVTRAGLAEIMQFCREQRVELLIARSSADDISAAHAMERAGFQLMDTLVYYARDLSEPLTFPGVTRLPARPMKAGEADAVEQVAATAFHDYRTSHFHADSRLNPQKSDAVYAAWARALCVSRGNVSEVLVACEEQTVVGFLGLRLNSADEGEGVLNGVLPTAQGKGIYTSLLASGLEWCRSQGAQRFLISTQLANWRVQQIWARLGFAAVSAYYTFHRWFSEEARATVSAVNSLAAV